MPSKNKIDVKHSVPCDEIKGTKCFHPECRFYYYTSEAIKARNEWIAAWKEMEKDRLPWLGVHRRTARSLLSKR